MTIAELEQRIAELEEELGALRLQARRLKAAEFLKSPEYRRRNAERMRKLFEDPAYRAKHRAAVIAAWQDPKRRAARSELMREVGARPEVKEKRRQAMAALWSANKSGLSQAIKEGISTSDAKREQYEKFLRPKQARRAGSKCELEPLRDSFEEALFGRRSPQSKRSKK